VHDLMAARRAVKNAKASCDQGAEAEAHRAVDRVKQALGERGPVWWKDGAPDLNRQMVKDTPYAAWYAREVRGRQASKRPPSPAGRVGDGRAGDGGVYIGTPVETAACPDKPI
jgi:hypothetical protein